LLTGEQIRAARAMLRMEQSTLAEEAGISVETIKRLEAQDGPIKAGRAATIAAIEKAFSAHGIEFTNGGEPGLRLRAKRKR
jgi:DNA-binding XRE family transcriptional regulator